MKGRMVTALLLFSLSLPCHLGAQIEAGVKAAKVVTGQEEIQDVSLRTASILTKLEAKQKLEMAAMQLRKFEQIYASVKEKTDMARDIYDVATFLTKNSGDINSIYMNYKNAVISAGDFRETCDRLLAEGKMCPSEYVYEVSRLSQDITDMAIDLDNFTKIFLNNDIKMSFFERFKEMKDLIFKWKEYNIQWNRKKKDLLTQAQKDSIREAINERIRRDAASALSITLTPEGITPYQISEGNLLYGDKEEKKRQIREALSVFSPGNIFGIVWTLIFIISAILVPTALWLYFKGDGERHKDAPLKIFVGLVATTLIMFILQAISGNANLNF